MILPKCTIERELLERGVGILVGVDEAGRGPLAGPVVAGAAWVSPDLFQKDFAEKKLIRDSKTLSEKQREVICSFIVESDDFCVAIGEVSHGMIDRINILNASLLAMRIAVEEVVAKLKVQSEKCKVPNSKFKGQSENSEIKNASGYGNSFCLLVDGNRKIPKMKCDQRLFCKGDRNVFSIAVASIVAKVHRDHLMQKYHEKFPYYGFDRHKGYGTRLHFQQIQKNGPCEIHRKSFGPVRDFLEKT